MITVKKRVVTFTGKDFKLLKAESKRLGISMQNVFTGMLWEYIMRKAREGVFNGKSKKRMEA